MAYLRRLILALAVLASAGGSAAAQPATYPIDVIISLTGPAAFAGKSEADALHLYEAIANRQGGIDGRPVHFVLHDDQSSAAVAVQLATAIIAEHPAVVLGGTLAQSCSAVAPLFVHGPVFLAFSPAFEPLRGSDIFVPLYSLESGVAGQLQYLLDRGLTRLAVISATDATGQGSDRVTEAALQSPSLHALHIVAYEHFNPTDLSIAAQAARIKAVAPQALIVWASGTSFGTVLHGLVDAGVDVPVVTTAANLVARQLAGYAGILPRELLTYGESMLNANRPPGDPLKDSVAEFIDTFRGAGLEPTIVAAVAWDPAKIAVAALRRLGPNAQAEQVRAFVQGLHDFPGAGGMYDFRSGDQHGLHQSAVLIVRWDAARSAYTLVSRQGGTPLGR